MTVLRTACIQLNSGNDIAANTETLLSWIEKAVARQAEFIATPENTFFMRGSEDESPPAGTVESHPGILRCREAAAKHGVTLLLGSVFVSAPDGRFFNRSVLIGADGTILTHYDKMHLFDASVGDGIPYRESSHIAPGSEMTLAELPSAKLGLSICYDLRFPLLYRQLAQRGADILAVPAAFTVPTGEAHWHVLLRARAIENGCFVIAPAQCGTHPGGRKTYGHSLIVGPWGEILAEGDASTPGVIMAELDLNAVTEARRKIPSLRDN